MLIVVKGVFFKNIAPVLVIKHTEYKRNYERGDHQRDKKYKQ